MPNAKRSYLRRYDHRHPVPRRARTECLRRSNHTCQGCGRKPATEAHHWTYPLEEETTANHLTGFCQDCHDLITWFIWFVSFGGSRELFRELFPALLARVLECPERPERRRVGRPRPLGNGWGAVVSGESSHRRGRGAAAAVLGRVARLHGDRRRRRPGGVLAGAHAPAEQARRGAPDVHPAALFSALTIEESSRSRRPAGPS